MVLICLLNFPLFFLKMFTISFENNTPYQVDNIFVDTLKGQVEPRQYFYVVFPKLLVQILQLRLCF